MQPSWEHRLCRKMCNGHKNLDVKENAQVEWWSDWSTIHLFPILSKVTTHPTLKIDQSSITPTTSARNIGVIFDNYDQMREHITTVCRESHFHLWNIGSIRRYLVFPKTLYICVCYIWILVTTTCIYLAFSLLFHPQIHFDWWLQLVGIK